MVVVYFNENYKSWDKIDNCYLVQTVGNILRIITLFLLIIANSLDPDEARHNLESNCLCLINSFENKNKSADGKTLYKYFPAYKFRIQG